MSETTRRQSTIARRAMRALEAADILEVTVTDAWQEPGACHLILRDETGPGLPGYYRLTLTITDDD